ncbi:YciI family protein [Planotetraspora silvatica]
MADVAQYLILIHGDEREWAAMSAQQREELAEGHRSLVKAAGAAVLDSRELEPATVATTLRADPAGRLTITDGPFLETKEAVGGYYLIEAADLDEVIGLASRLYEVSAGHSGVEIRPVVDHG